MKSRESGCGVKRVASAEWQERMTGTLSTVLTVVLGDDWLTVATAAELSQPGYFGLVWRRLLALDVPGRTNALIVIAA